MIHEQGPLGCRDRGVVWLWAAGLAARLADRGMSLVLTGRNEARLTRRRTTFSAARLPG